MQGPLITRRERLIAQAAENGFTEGFERGLLEGQANGRTEAYASTEDERQELITAQVAQFQSDIESMGAEMRAAMAAWFLQAEQELGRIAILAAERLVRRELDVDTTVVLDIVRETMREVTHAEEARILVNPYDLKFLMGREEELNRIAPSVRNITFAASHEVQAGCRIETDGGTIDARIEEGLRRLALEGLGR